MFATKNYLVGGQQPPLIPQYHSRHTSYQPYSTFQNQQLQQQMQHLPPPPLSRPQQYQHQHSMSYSAGYDLNNYYTTPYGSGAPSVAAQPARNEYYMLSLNQQQQQQQSHLPPPPSIQDQPVVETESQTQPTGGVSSVLDYDMDQMVRFVCWLCYGLMKRSDNPSTSFHNTVRSVLAATRLPKSTIVLALLYLSDKMEYQEEPIYGDSEVFQNLTISLVLSNKFNDDNTFRNKSWSDATGLDVLLINSMERSWLSDIKWRLHYEDGYACIEECWKTWCEKFQVNKSNSCTPLLPSLDVVYNISTQGDTSNTYQPLQQQPQLPPLSRHQAHVQSYDVKSPSDSLFSENSQFSPVNTPSNSSPWFSDYQQPQNLQPPGHQQQQAFENPYQVQYNASLVSQQVANTTDYYAMYSQLNHHPVMKPQQQSHHSVYLNHSGSLPPPLNQTPVSNTPLPLPLPSVQTPTPNASNNSHQRYYSLGHFHYQSSSQIPSMMTTGSNSFYNNNGNINDYYQQYYNNPNNYGTASVC